jgi:hypothetical protein
LLHPTQIEAPLLKPPVALLFALELAGTAACRHPAPAPSAPYVGKGSLRGYVRLGPEQVSFQACGSDRKWWLAPANAPGWSDAVRVLEAQPECDLGYTPCALQEVFVDADGQVSPPGEYGHLGRYAREVRLSRVYWASRAAPEECAQPPARRRD